MAVRHLKRQRPQAAEWRALVAGSYLPPAAFDELFAGVVQLAAAVLRLADAKFQPARVADQLAALKLPPQVRPSKQRIPKPLRTPRLGTGGLPAFLSFRVKPSSGFVFDNVHWALAVVAEVTEFPRRLSTIYWPTGRRPGNRRCRWLASAG